jgi:hypothetical protein
MTRVTECWVSTDVIARDHDAMILDAVRKITGALTDTPVVVTVEPGRRPDTISIVAYDDFTPDATVTTILTGLVKRTGRRLLGPPE